MKVKAFSTKNRFPVFSHQDFLQLSFPQQTCQGMSIEVAPQWNNWILNWVPNFSDVLILVDTYPYDKTIFFRHIQQFRNVF